MKLKYEQNMKLFESTLIGVREEPMEVVKTEIKQSAKTVGECKTVDECITNFRCEGNCKHAIQATYLAQLKQSGGGRQSPMESADNRNTINCKQCQFVESDKNKSNQERYLHIFSATKWI